MSSAASVPADLRPLAPAFAERTGFLLAGLCALIAARFLRHFTLQPVLNPLWGRLNRARQRIAHLMSRLAAGRSFAARAPRPRPQARAARAARQVPPAIFPARPGWLLRELRHEAAFYRNGLETLLAQPGMAELLLHSPGTVRLLRPLCRMLALDMPALLRPPPRARPAPATPPPQVVARPTPPEIAGARRIMRFPFNACPLHPIVWHRKTPA